MIPPPKSMEPETCHPNMKIFGARILKLSLGRHAPPKPAGVAVEERSSAFKLKIIHAGGRTECYYMAVPAARIMEKYPSSILARPEVFRRPWDSVVRPEEILIPGQKFFIVPCNTVKKLRRRIRKPSGENFSKSFVSQASTDSETNSQQEDDNSGKSLNSSINKSSGRIKARNRRVRFLGIDVKHDGVSVSTEMEKKENAEDDHRKTENSSSISDRRKVRVRNSGTRQPNLTVISENE